jgi:hypothetical protein
MDATTAISEGGVNVVLQKALALAHKTAGETQSWGPFFATYSASVSLAGGTATLENAPANKLDLNGLTVSGAVSGSVGFDLGRVLPELCIPPVRICIHIDWFGTFCIPRFCVTWPHVNVGLALPFAFGLDVSFGFRVDDLGSKWGIVLLIDPFSPRFDLTPMGPVIIAALKAKVTSVLSGIPVIGSLVADLVNTVLDAFTPVMSLLIGAFGALINAVLMLLDLLNVAIPVTLLTFNKQQTFIPANIPLSGDAPVQLSLSGLAANVRDRELVVEGQLA